jgi:hypothetical protein
MITFRRSRWTLFGIFSVFLVVLILAIVETKLTPTGTTIAQLEQQQLGTWSPGG